MSWTRDTAEALADLILPDRCPGCGTTAPGGAVCAGCAAELNALTPFPTRPDPAPVGMPPCVALAPYEGTIRQCLLAYKERDRYRLADPLGGLLARGVRTAVGTRPVLLVPVPDTARAARARYGDHVLRLAGRAARVLRADGQPAAVAPVLRARPRPDSAALDAVGRARTAVGAFVPRAHRLRQLGVAASGGGLVVLVDDIVTTGATLATTTAVLGSCQIKVCHAVVVSATRRHRASPRFSLS